MSYRSSFTQEFEKIAMDPRLSSALKWGLGTAAASAAMSAANDVYLDEEIDWNKAILMGLLGGVPAAGIAAWTTPTAEELRVMFGNSK